jgi:adenine deaminase
MHPTDFIKRLPKAELHLHLEGAVPWDMIRAAAGDAVPEKPECWAADFRYDDFAHFGRTINLGNIYVFKNMEGYRETARRVFQGLADQNARYVETSFAPEQALRYGLSVEDVATAIKAAAPEGLCVAVYCGFNRERPPDDKVVSTVFAASTVDGIDLHGTERLGTAEPFANVFRQAQERGLCTKAHAGELAGAQSVWEALNHLKVKRIEHGTRAIEDAALVDYLADEGITLDLCPTSNWKLRVVDDVAKHPIKRFFERGIPVTVNTDDPTFFGCTLNGEVSLLVETLGFTLAQAAEVQKNAFRAAKMDDSARNAILAEIDALVSELPQ